MNEPKFPQNSEITVIDALDMYENFKSRPTPEYNLKEIASMAVEELPILENLPACPLLIAAYCGMSATEAAEFAQDYNLWKENQYAGNIS